MAKGKDLTSPQAPAPATINREEIAKQNRDIARELWQTKLSPRERQALNNLTIQYGLDPLQKQLLCLGGNFYVTVGGLKVIAEHNETPPVAIQLEPASMDDRIAAGITKNDPTKPDYVHVWKAYLYKKGSEIAYTEYGEASASDIGIRGQSGGAPKEKDIRAVARTRATGRVLRNAYSIGLPLAEDAPVDIAVIEAEVVNEAGPDTEPAETSKPGTEAQLKKIHVLKKKAIDNGAIEELDYYKALNFYKAEHSNELNREQRGKIIEWLEKKIDENEPPEEETKAEEPMSESDEDFFKS